MLISREPYSVKILSVTMDGPYAEINTQNSSFRDRLRYWCQEHVRPLLIRQIGAVFTIMALVFLSLSIMPGVFQAMKGNAKCDFGMGGDIAMINLSILAYDAIARYYFAFIIQSQHEMPFWRFCTFLLMYPILTSMVLDMPLGECDDRLKKALYWQWSYMTIIIFSSCSYTCFLCFISNNAILYPSRPMPLTNSDISKLPRFKFSELKVFWTDAVLRINNTIPSSVPQFVSSNINNSIATNFNSNERPDKKRPDALDSPSSNVQPDQIPPSLVMPKRPQSPPKGPGSAGIPLLNEPGQNPQIDDDAHPTSTIASPPLLKIHPPPPSSSPPASSEGLLAVPSTPVSPLPPSPPDACSICLEDFEDQSDVVVLPACRHVFHPNCVAHWLKQTAICPVCRTDLRGGREGSNRPPIGIAATLPLEPSDATAEHYSRTTVGGGRGESEELGTNSGTEVRGERQQNEARRTLFQNLLLSSRIGNGNTAAAISEPTIVEQQERHLGIRDNDASSPQQGYGSLLHPSHFQNGDVTIPRMIEEGGNVQPKYNETTANGETQINK